MDVSGKGWYFSPVPRLARGKAAPRRIDFHRTKYGRELLVDAAFVHQMPTFIRNTSEPHVLTFHDILLVTRGRGRFRIDGEVHRVAPGAVFFSSPGEVRQWEVKGLDGACLFFRDEFLAAFFSDPHFVEAFAFFRTGRPSAALRLPRPERVAFLERFGRMQAEIAALRADAPHALRAVLYEILVLLGRGYTSAHGESPRAAPSRVERFRALVERDLASRHRVHDYAAELGLSPGHLNALCQGELDRSAGAWIRARLTLEAKRLLLYSDRTIAQIGEDLGFLDPAYFARFFRRETGEAPSRYRACDRSRPA